MLLEEIAVQWNKTSTSAASTADIVVGDAKFTLTLVCNRQMPAHIRGWIDEVTDVSTDMGRYAKISNIQQLGTSSKSSVMLDAVRLLKERVTKQHLKYIVMFSSTVSQQTNLRALTKQLSDKLKWDVYQDRNYFIVYTPSIDVHEPD